MPQIGFDDFFLIIYVKAILHFINGYRNREKLTKSLKNSSCTFREEFHSICFHLPKSTYEKLKIDALKLEFNQKRFWIFFFQELCTHIYADTTRGIERLDGKMKC